MDVCPKKNSLLRPGNAPCHPGKLNLLGHTLGFQLVVVINLKNDSRAIAFLRPELFAAALNVVANEAVCGAENRVGRTIVLLELDDLYFGIMLLHVEQVGDFRAAPSVNGLVVISHHAEVAMLASQLMHQLELGGVGVLVLIHHHIAKTLAAGFQSVWLFVEKP